MIAKLSQAGSSKALVRFLPILAALGIVSGARAAIINTADAGQIGTFQSGANIENFDNLSAVQITSYTGVTVTPPTGAFNGRNLNDKNLPNFNSGGGNPGNPTANPGVPIGIFDPEGAIAGEVKSQNNVAGPLATTDVTTPPPLPAFDIGFMEIVFQNSVDKIGFWVTHGTVTLILKEAGGLNNLVGGDVTVTGSAGNFVGISRPAADIGGASLFGVGGTFTIDDLTSTKLGGSTPPPPTSSVPEAGSILNLVLAGGFLFGARRMFKRG
jgi:hypothetical protein